MAWASTRRSLPPPGTASGWWACRSARPSSARVSRSKRRRVRARRSWCACPSVRAMRRFLMPEVSNRRRARVLLADDHATVRYGLKLLIDAEPDMIVVAEAGDGDEAVRKTLQVQPDIVVMDISMPGMNGLAATRTLKQASPGMLIITLTRHTDEAYLHEL